jgi:hypothetical protein
MICPVITSLTQRLTDLDVDDPSLNACISKLKLRSAIGVQKYGHTLARKDITERGWLNHAQKEALDLVAYIEAHRHHHGGNLQLDALQDQALATATMLEAMMKELSPEN